MTIPEIAKRCNISERTVQRRIKSFNQEKGSDHQSNLRSIITDQVLLHYLLFVSNDKEVNSLEGDIRKEDDTNQLSERFRNPVKAKKKKKVKPDSTSLQKMLSADWIVITVLTVILFADMFAFGVIGNHQFGTTIPYAGTIFSIIGIATGAGSIVAYSRISNIAIAELWKWIFAILQFLVFSLSINEEWFFAELIMTTMFVMVFIGVQRSIKN